MKYLVTGGNGHLGNQVVRKLVKQGEDVRVSVRNPKDLSPFRGVDCEVVYADIFDIASLEQAVKGIDIVIHCAAIFKHWSKDPQKDIVNANVTATENVMKAVQRGGTVKKMIYISSMAALDGYLPVLDERSWGKRFPNPYFEGKMRSEKRAWELAKEYAIPMITILPSSIVGPHWSSEHLTPTLNFINLIKKGKLPFDPQVVMSLVHVEDVVDAIISSLTKGRAGERYLIANDSTMSSTRMIELARRIDPSLRAVPGRGKWFQMSAAFIFETVSQFTNKPPLLLRGNIDFYYKATRRFDISKARAELGYSPRRPEEAFEASWDYLQ